MVPSYSIPDSKYVVETISYFADFSPDFLPGEIIVGIPDISVTVVSGDDPDPSHMLYQGASVIRGVKVEQRLRLGLGGCIYSVAFTIGTTAGNTYTRDTRIAVLANPSSALPEFTIQYETSSIYPYIWADGISNSLVIQGGRFTKSAYFYDEGISNSINILSGSMTFHGLIPYSYEEGITNGITIVSGTLVNYPIIPYSYDEGIYNTIVIVSGVLVNYPILTYSYAEGITNGLTIISGTLA